MTTALSAGLSAELREMHRQRLCDEYPYLSRDALDKILDDSITAIEAGIAKQMPAIAAAKTRTNFTILPAELRNAVYELALAPHVGKKRRLWVRSGKFTTETRAPGDTSTDWFPPLLEVSRQIRDEALSVFWDVNEVVLEIVVSGHGTKHSTIVRIKAQEDRVLLRRLGQKQCGMMTKVVLKWQKAFLQESLLLPVSEIFQQLGLGRLGIREQVIELDQAVPRLTDAELALINDPRRGHWVGYIPSSMHQRLPEV